MKKWLLTALGVLLLAVGAVGLIFPVWPTTPFVLLAAGCFAAGNPGIYRRLAASPLFGEYIRNYKEKTGISVRTKASSLAFLWVMLGLSVWFTHRLWVALLLLGVGIGVTVHILLLRTRRKEGAPDAAPRSGEPAPEAPAIESTQEQTAPAAQATLAPEVVQETE